MDASVMYEARVDIRKFSRFLQGQFNPTKIICSKLSLSGMGGVGGVSGRVDGRVGGVSGSESGRGNGIWKED